MTSRLSRVGAFTLAALFFATGSIALAGTTGSITGTVRDNGNHPISGVSVTAASPSGNSTVTTDAAGFYNIANLSPDTYVVSFAKSGFDAAIDRGIVVFQDQTVTLDASLRAQHLTEIGSVQSRSSQTLVQPGQTADVYNISSKQLEAAQGGDNVHKTLYNFTQSVPGVTGSGANAQPRVRGGLATDANFLYDDVPINDRLTGFFSTNNGYFLTTTISSVGVSNVQVYTGGYDARFGQASQGVFNSVVRRGRYPTFGLISTAVQGPLYGHYIQGEFGTGTPDGKFSAFVAFDGAHTNNQFGDGVYSFPLAQLPQGGGNGPGPQKTTDLVGNFHYRPNAKNDWQFLAQTGVGKFDSNYLLSGGNPMRVTACSGVQGTWVAYPTPPATPPPNVGYNITNPGVSSTGQPCVVTSNGRQYATGLQYQAIDPNSALETYHYSDVLKLQLNHVFNEKLSGFVRLAENFNQYILNQALNNPNYANALHTGDAAPGPAPQGSVTGCPGGARFCPYGYPGSTRDIFGDRRQQAYIGSAQLNFVPNAHSEYYAGGSYERVNALQAYYDLSGTGGFSLPASAFDALGNYPNLYTLVDFPDFITGFYAGTRQRVGKWQIDPSIRYDRETYGLPKSVGGYYSTGIWSPRLAVAYQMRPDLVIRASYGITSNFVPATYVYNDTVDGPQGAGQYRTPFIAFANVKPSSDRNYDMSIEKAFPDGRTSLRITPWYHSSSNRLAVTRTPQTNPDGSYIFDTNGNLLFNPGSYAESSGITQDFGVEFGLNHLVAGDGWSWFLAATYQNYFASSTTLNAAAIGPNSPAKFYTARTMYRVTGQPPVSLSFTGNYNYKRYHFLPFLLYQCCGFYNTMRTGTSFAPDPTIHTGPAYYYANATLSYDMFRQGPHVSRLGMRVTNVFGNTRADITPSTNSCYNRPASAQTGVCANGGVYDGSIYAFPAGAVPNTLYFYPPVSKNPQTFELFLTQEF